MEREHQTPSIVFVEEAMYKDVEGEFKCRYCPRIFNQSKPFWDHLNNHIELERSGPSTSSAGFDNDSIYCV